MILIQVPSVQNFAKNKAVTFLEKKIKTKVEIGHISLGLPKLLILEDVYFEDQKKDTLIAGDKLKVDISMLQLLHNKVEINEINLQGITAKISRGPDSLFNFNYILKAFAGEQKKEVKAEDTTSTMKFSMDKIILDRISVVYKDVVSGNDVKFWLGHFDTRIKDFDLEKMKFTVPKITLSDVNATVIQTAVTPPPRDTATAPLNLDLGLGTIDISKVKVVYRTVEMDANVDLSKFLVEMDKIDLKNQQVAIKSIALNDTKAFMTFAKPQTVKKQVEKVIKKLDTLASNPNKNGWRATLGKITLVNDDLKFDNEVQQPIARGLDFAHMHIRALNADVQDISYSPDTIKGKVNSFTFNEKSGLAVKKFHTTFLYGPTSAYLNDLLLETPQTVIQKQVQVSYPSIAAITKNIGLLKVNANVDGTKINLKDVLLLMPTMASMEPFKSSPNSVFRIDGRVEGGVNNLNIPNFEVRGLRNTHIKASARLRGLPDMNKAYFDVNLADFNTSAGDIAKLAPKGTIPANIRVPDNMNLKGTFKGSMYNFNTKLNLRTNLGAADVVAGMKNGNSKTKASYVANIRANNLNVGAITKQPQMVGMVTMAANVKGRGLDPKKASLAFDGSVASAYVKGYTYKNLKLKGTAVNGAYTVVSTMNDPNIHFALNAKANLNKKYPAITANLMLDSIDLQALKLSTTPLRLHGKIIADVPTADPDYLNANIKATNLLVVTKDQRIKVDSISLISTANADSSALRLKTPFLNARMSGKYKLTEVGTAMQDMVNKYFDTSLGAAKSAAKPAYSPQQFTFAVRIIKSSLLEQFAPTLTTLDPVNITGRFNSSTGEFVANGTIPKVVYGTQVINNGKLNINTANNALNYALTVDEVKVGSSLDLLYPSITGNAQNNKLNVSLQVRDAARKERYRIAGVMTALPDLYQFSFLQDGVMFNYIPWAVSADNALQFGSKGILARNFAITNNNQILSVNSVGTDYNSPLKVAFRDFHIETITQMAQQDSLQVGGVINGEANISDFQSAMKFTAQLDVKDFSFKGDTVGNIALKVNNQTANAYSADMSITGKGNQVNLKGIYYTTPASRFDLDLNIVKLNVKSIEGFSFGAIRNAKGTITGQLKVTGTTDVPVVRGDVNFNEVGFNVSMLNSYFTMPKEVITFNEDGVLFRDFTLVDSTGNKAIVSGTLYTKTFTDFRFGMDINATNFRAVNSTKADNKLFYGKLYVDTRIQIRGNMDAPKVDANLTVNDKTDMTFVLPSDDPGVVDRKGVVEVIDQDAPKLDSILLARQLDSLKQSNLRGMDVNATIKVSKLANFNVVIDERNGDVVNIRGEANLQGGIDPSGKINLTGTYVVERGSYNLSYATVSRTFNFKKGSTINWTGDPTSAMVDLTAVYVANVPPIDLVNQQMGDDGSNLTMYKQKLPFNVNLNLKNELLKPDISFDIVLPDSNYTVSPGVIDVVNARLSQIRANPNELNKQVLGVLVLGHFIGDNPLQSAGGSTGVNGVIRNSVSNLLSDQLNKLAGNLGGGVQLSFGVTSGADYSSGVQQNRTDLNVGLSKQFLNDRLTVSVGNNFNLEGQNQPGQKSSQIAGNLSVNYKLTADGRYMLRAYRRDQYVVVQGQVVETGLAFSLTYEYNRFMELFKRKPREERELQKEYKEKEKAKDEVKKEAEKAHDETVVEPVVQPANKPAEKKEPQD
ncbi:translocation/assembly module TamB domain-containing protein [Mucilaginibacter antarcticus]|uniref:Translocation/assembly module TamB domain-containing protein n=1 Tax=Mucilaginibacter antarcticus TaxID=1855725 RepID=A0ABW5XQE8_9SPHI